MSLSLDGLGGEVTTWMSRRRGGARPRREANEFRWKPPLKWELVSDLLNL